MKRASYPVLLII